MPFACNMVAAMSVEELRSFSQVPADISLELSNDSAAPTVEGQIMPFSSPESNFPRGFASLSLLW